MRKLCGDRVVVVTNNDDAYRTALALHRAGLIVPVIVDARPRPEGELLRQARDEGLRIEAGRGIAKLPDFLVRDRLREGLLEEVLPGRMREAGVFRVNYRTGEMSICFVLVKKEQVVCTQQAKPGAEGASDAPLTGPAPGRAGASATPAQGGRF